MSGKNPYRGDARTKQAKAAGFPARSVYKLEEIDHRTRLLRVGHHVLDLGASPGSWAMYAQRKIGRGGKLLAVDLKPLEVTLHPPAEFMIGDALTIENEALGKFAPYDVVLSDMAPSTTGTRFSDQARSTELFLRALEVAVHFLKPGGAFVGKIFMGEDFPAARAEVRKHFREERLIRPEGTRTVSYEIFVIGQGKRGENDAGGPEQR